MPGMPGMDHTGHSGHGDHLAQFRTRFWWCLALAVPVVVFSPMFGGLLGYRIDFPGALWISPVIGTVIFAYGGAPFLTGAVGELRARRPGMMTLIAMAISVAFVASWATVVDPALDIDFWWELALLIVIMLLGHWIEMRALASSSGALDALAALLPDTAEVVHGEHIMAMPAATLGVGDIVLVRPGGRIPADGEVVDGEAQVDESMVTGESRTVVRGLGARVVAGTVVADTAIRVRVTAIGEQTALAGIRRLVAEAQASSSRAQALADRFAAWLFYFAAGAGVITFVVWLFIGSPSDAVSRAVTVLVIACPHALGLAIPLVIAISTGRAARSGVLVKDRLALERMRTVGVVLFDKTGTLTRGEPALAGTATDGMGEQDAVALVAAVEASSEHPLARALVRAADAAGGDHPVATGFRSDAGRGVAASIAGVAWRVGGARLIDEARATVPERVAAAAAEWAAHGATVLYLVRDGAAAAAFALEDEVRPESAPTVAALHRLGIRVAMITGDSAAVADAVAARLGIDEVFAGVLPADKDGKVAELQHRGLSVAVVGDGINDAPALARADVGIAIGAGTDVAIESAGIVLASSDPRAVLSAIALSRASYRKMIQNLVWAAGYNVVAVPLAAGVLAPVGFVLAPAVGAVLMSLSTIIVALNAQLLRRVDLDPARLAARLAGRE
ncbi:heavy metal translocating P-type ATPase [Gryllotalpicola sp.]|uniref:heavy metal translocating P-type ATPase n=1 Tax=Gryllotalpicola sp. TaxID=1932787 RepID=UPI0026274D91|nr:heavy metal translocating P-type ATPase [Gryllotalpicola sp.]